MPVLLPAGLPAGFTVEPGTGAHAPEVFEVRSAELVDAYGFCPDTAEDVRAEMEPSPDSETLQLLVREPDRTMVQWWGVIKEPGDPVFHAWLSSHPRLPAHVHDDLSAAGWDTLFGWIRQHAPAGDGTIEVRSGCPAGAQAGHRRLQAAGFTHRRTFWEMSGPVTHAARAAPEVAGLTISERADPRVLHAVLDRGFEGHWGHTPLGFDDWMAVEPTFAGYDPDLWYLGSIDGEPAAGMILSRRVESDGAMYVQELATLERYRRRGIASALLATAFEVAAREGLPRLSLHVDSENSHGAPSVYGRAGLDVRCAFHAHVRHLDRSA